MADFGFLGKALFGIFQKGVLEGEGGHDTTWGGDPPSVAGQGWGVPWLSTWHSHMAYSLF